MQAIKATERERDKHRKAEGRANDRDLVIPDVLDWKRRRACEEDDQEWLRTYLSDVFYNPFTPDQVRTIEDAGTTLRYGTKKCKAAPRGDGKSSILKSLALKYSLCRGVRFPLIAAATSSKSNKILNSLKKRLASNKQSPLTEDYPLETAIARYVNPWPSRARNVTANGRRRIHVEWGADWFIVPTWEDDEPLGPILMSLGITSDELQGCNIYDVRPDWVLLDDLDSRDSLASEDGVVAEKIEEIIDKTVPGLGGQNRRLGVFMLCTITSRKSAAYRYSDPEAKPAFSGERVAAISEWPHRTDLWQTYIELRQWGKQTRDENGQPVDVFGRKAHKHFEDNFEAMIAGVILSNPNNYERDLLPDGSPKHIHALQRCYDYIADEGMDSFLTEHQNDPPDDGAISESTISPQAIQRQVSGFDRGAVPPGCTVLVHGIDIGKWEIHWVVRAFKPDGTGYTIDYGISRPFGQKHGKAGVSKQADDALDRAIHRAILTRIAEFQDQPYFAQFDETLTLVDSGYRSEAVYAACRAAGLGVMPIKGIGKSAGVSQIGEFTDVMRRTKDKKPICDGVYMSTIREPRQQPFDLACASADQWKAWEHDRWMTSADKPGCMFLFGSMSERPEVMSPDQREHGAYAAMICNEKEVEEVVKGALKRYWKASGPNHWLDASYYADVAAAIKGIRILTPTVAVPGGVPAPSQRPTAAQLAGRR